MGRIVALSLVLFGGGLSAFAQRLDDGQVAFEEKARLSRILRQQLFKGEVQADPKDKAHLEAIEYAAKEVTYPLVWKSLGGRPR
ncbi:MAG: hypothetical protein ACKO23_19480, partial [Gemmataceae bacterium]